MGLADRFRRTTFTANGSARILLFHRVCQESGLLNEPDTAVSADLFGEVITDVAENHQPVSIAELAKRVRRGQSIEGCVAVTFDDGFADNLLTALPILEEQRVPATVYVTSGFISGDVKPLEYELAQLIAHCERIQFDGQGWNTTAEAKECYEAIRQVLKFASSSVRTDAIERLWESAPVRPETPPQFQFLNAGQLLQLDASPWITIGAHTHAHCVLTAVTPAEAKQDVLEGKKWLESQLGHPVVDFAYPYGAYDDEIAKLVRLAGFHTAVTTLAEPLGGLCNLMAIPRIEINTATLQSSASVLSVLGR